MKKIFVSTGCVRNIWMKTVNIVAIGCHEHLPEVVTERCSLKST